MPGSKPTRGTPGREGGRGGRAFHRPERLGGRRESAATGPARQTTSGMETRRYEYRGGAKPFAEQ